MTAEHALTEYESAFAMTVPPTTFVANGIASVTVAESAELNLCNFTTAGESIGGGGRKRFVTKDIEIT
jgi:hypothetical protein